MPRRPDPPSAEYLRLLAKEDQLLARRADLMAKKKVRAILTALRELAAEDGCCPVCRGAVPADPAPGAT